MTSNQRRKFMSSRIKGLILGPLIIIVLGFLFFGEWGAIIGFFVGIAAAVFIPVFGAVSQSLGVTSFLPLAALANSIPIAFWALNCLGQSCPNYSLAAAAPQYIAATFCAFIVWLFVRKS